jgi:sec-independent protein translocase protein TatB
VFNVTGSEIVIVLLLALVVLGPEKLPDAVRRFAKTYAELKKVGTGFQREFKAAMDEPLREMRETADLLRTSADFGAMVDPTRTTSESSTSTTSTDSTTAAAAGAVVAESAGQPEPVETAESAETSSETSSTTTAEPTEGTEEPARPKQIWSAAPPYRRPAVPTDGAGDGTDVPATDTDGVEDRSA